MVVGTICVCFVVRQMARATACMNRILYVLRRLPRINKYLYIYKLYVNPHMISRAIFVCTSNFVLQFKFYATIRCAATALRNWIQFDALYSTHTNGLYTECTRFTINLERSAINVACFLSERTNWGKGYFERASERKRSWRELNTKIGKYEREQTKSRRSKYEAWHTNTSSHSPYMCSIENESFT